MLKLGQLVPNHGKQAVRIVLDFTVDLFKGRAQSGHIQCAHTLPAQIYQTRTDPSAFPPSLRHLHVRRNSSPSIESKVGKYIENPSHWVKKYSRTVGTDMQMA
jgi:hypothetical protein